MPGPIGCIRDAIAAEALQGRSAAEEPMDPDQQDGRPVDLLVGARQIAAALGLTDRQVRHIAEKGQMPIWNEPGLGLTSTRTALHRYIRQRAEAAVRRGG